MAILEAQDKMVTEIESEVDVQVNLNHDGLTFSLYIDEEHLLFDAMIYELKASTYFIYEDMKYNYTVNNYQ